MTTLPSTSLEPVRSPTLSSGIEHLGAELAGFLDDGADGVLVDAIQNAAGDQPVEPRRGLQRMHDVVHWSLVGHAFLAP